MHVSRLVWPDLPWGMAGKVIVMLLPSSAVHEAFALPGAMRGTHYRPLAFLLFTSMRLTHNIIARRRRELRAVVRGNGRLEPANPWATKGNWLAYVQNSLVNASLATRCGEERAG